MTDSIILVDTEPEVDASAAEAPAEGETLAKVASGKWICDLSFQFLA
jgi:hypothetical protein